MVARAGLMYVTNFSSGTVSVIDTNTNTVDRPIGVGTEGVRERPSGIAYDPSHGNMYVANLNSNSVSVINTMGVVATIAVGNRPFALAFERLHFRMYV